MVISPQDVKVVVYREVYGFISDLEVEQQYRSLMKVLHGNEADAVAVNLPARLALSSELFVFLLHDRCIIASAQVTLASTFPKPHAYINNVAVLPEYQQYGLGRVVIEQARFHTCRKWGCEEQDIILELTNNPKKKNGTFYQKLGFRARADNRWPVRLLKWLLDAVGWKAKDETVVWVQDV